ncbi:hypothetical protein JIQ42_02115 [Leishmania sp. Namibia]|uniref:hypothetical protein n=1 Tax=Leishmania sp. Namibia TaxID=2802991 RepID=UPI001B56A5BB|nr:hypothetical protein JIQ42_02115 [Leishmania sp. Namibia]
MSTSASSELAVTRHKIGFKGEEWSDIVLEHRKAIAEAFQSDTAEALGISCDDVFDISLFENSFTVYFAVRHPGSLSKSDVKRILVTGAYLRVWKFYFDYKQAREVATDAPLGSAATAASPVVSKGKRDGGNAGTANAPNSPCSIHFGGDDWEPVLALHMLELQQAAELDIANALKDHGFHVGDADAVSGRSASSVTLKPVKDGAVLTYSIPHERSTDQRHQQKALLARYAYPHVWSKFTQLRIETSVIETRHRVFLEGDQWERVLAASPEKISRALREDVGTLLHLSVDAVKPPTCTGSLELEFAIQHAATISTATIEAELMKCTYERTRLVYEAVTGFKLLGTAPQSTSLMTEELENEKASQSDESARDEHIVNTRHHLRFPGFSWQQVLKEKEAALHGAVISDVAEQLSLQESQVTDVSFTSALKVTFAVSHAPALTRREIDQLLGEGNFSRTWQLYMETDPPASTQRHDTLPTADGETTESMQTSGTTAAFTSSSAADAVTSHHRVRFHGAEWALVINDTREQLRKAFVADVEIALGVSTDAVESVIFHQNSPIVEFKLIHAPCLDSQEIARRLSAFQFSRTWAEYLHFAADIMEAVAKRTTTHHCVRLEGAEWGALLEAQSTQLKAALVTDVATSLHLSKNDITKVIFSLGSLIANMDIRHEAEWSQDATNQRLASCPYTETWALYRRFLVQEGLLVAGAAPPAALHATESFVSLGVEEQPPAPVRVGTPEQLLPAVQRATPPPAALHATESFVSCDDERLDTASAAVSVEAAPARELSHRASEPQAYSRDDLAGAEAAVLHQREEEAATDTHIAVLVEPPVGLVVTTHRLRLEGDAWEAILQQWRELLMREFTSDVCDATLLPSASVQGLVLSAGSLTADFQLSHRGVPAGELNQLLAAAPFTRTWALYQRLLVQEGLLVAGAATPPAALHATESFVSLGVEEQPPAPVRVGTPEQLLPAVQRATPPPAALHATESFVSLGVEEQPPAPVRVGTPEQLLPAVQRATPPPAALHATESFVSCDDERLDTASAAVSVEAAPARELSHRASEPQAYSRDDLAGAEAAVLHQREEEAATDTHIAVLVEPPVGLVVTTHRLRLEGDAWEAILQQWRELLMREFTSDVCDATLLPSASVQGLVLSAGSLTADFQLSHRGVPAGELNQLLAAAPFTRTWALYQRLLVQEGLLVAGAATPPAALHATESFVSLGVEEQPPAPVRVGTPEQLLPAVQRATPPPAALHATESFVSLGVEEQPPAPVRVGTPEQLLPAVQRATPPPAALHATESFVSCDDERLDTASAAVSVEAAPARELSHRASEPQAYSRDDLAGAEAAVLHQREEEAATDTHIAVLVEPPVGLVVTTHRLRLEGDAWEAILQQWRELLMREFTSDVCDATLLPSASVQGLVLSAGSLTADFQLSHRGVPAGELNQLLAAAPFTRTWALYQRLLVQEGLLVAGAATPAALHATESFVSLGVEEQPPAPVRVGTPEQLLPAVQRATPPPAALHATESFVSLGVEEQPPAPVRVGTPEQLLPAVQRATPPPAALHATESFVSCDDERLDTASAAVSVEAAPARELSHRASEPQAYSRDDLAGAEAAVLHQREEEAATDTHIAVLVEPPVGLVVTTHRLRLEGDAWEAILQQWRELLMREFTSDVCDATLLPSASVQGLVLSAGSLTADFQLSHRGVPAGELNQLLAAAPFTRTWALYQRLLVQEGLLVAGAATPAALHATESFVSLGVEEQPPAPVRVGTPEQLLPAVQRATPPPAALHATESFVSLGVEEQPPAPVRVGTPEQLLPAVQRATPPPAALHATESFVSCDDERLDTASAAVSVEAAPARELSHRASEPQAYSRDDLAGAEAAVLHQREEEAATDTHIAVLVEPPVGLVVTTHRLRLEGDAWEAILQQWRELLMREFTSDVCDATLLPSASVQGLVLSAGSLTADFQLSHRGVPAGELNQLLAAAPFTRTWALYQRLLVQEGLLVAGAATPAALHATESFVSLGVEEQPPAPVRVGTPEQLLPAVQRATPPPAALHATESFVSLGSRSSRLRLCASAPRSSCCRLCRERRRRLPPCTPPRASCRATTSDWTRRAPPCRWKRPLHASCRTVRRSRRPTRATTSQALRPRCCISARKRQRRIHISLCLWSPLSGWWSRRTACAWKAMPGKRSCSSGASC